MGTFETSQLDKSLLDIIMKLKEGEISYPKRLEVSKNVYGYHIVKLIKRIPQHKANVDIDYSDLKRMSEYYKKQKLYADWIKDIKSRVFWEIRL